jgi:Phosphotransferase enzyme family
MSVQRLGTTFIMQSSDIPEPVRDAAVRLAPSPVLAVEELHKGANSRVFRVKAADGNYAMKKYPLTDSRDRQGAEARALRFFERARISETPRLVACDTDNRVSLMSWLDGAAVTAVSNADVEQFAEFQLRLDRAIDDAARRQIGAASEACNSGARIVAQARARLDRLVTVRDTVAGFADFFDNALSPALAAFEKNARRIYSTLGQDFDADLPQERLTLIASDFGAHNVLRFASGRLAFVDFEYFGWDDPVTSVANFILHPGMELSEEQRAIYVDRLVAHFGAAEGLRIKALLPLYGVRWCAIILSDLLPERWQHRIQATSDGRNWSRVREEQFSKARRLLAGFAAS